MLKLNAFYETENGYLVKIKHKEVLMSGTRYLGNNRCWYSEEGDLIDHGNHTPEKLKIPLVECTDVSWGILIPDMTCPLDRIYGIPVKGGANEILLSFV